MKLSPTLHFRIRIKNGDEIAAGPGKIDLLEALIETGSISQAARKLGMSYRRAWLLIDAMNRSFQKPVVDTLVGGRRGGGTSVTDLGKEVIRRYRDVESISERAAAGQIKALLGLLRTKPH